MVGLLERLLSPFTAGSDGLGVELEVGAAGVHVVQLGSALVISTRRKNTNGYITNKPYAYMYLVYYDM